MLSAAAVANEFLKLQEEDPGFPKIDHMKLQKLVYYAHAWYMAFYNSPLFDDDIEAWPWGPVIRNIYVDFKDFGRTPIVGKRASKIAKSGPDAFDFTFTTPIIEDEEKRVFVRSVWDVLKKYTGVQLSNATHADGEPWAIVREKYGSLDSKPKIENDLIYNVFRSKVDNDVAA